MGNGCIQVWKTYVLCSFVYEKACECNDLKMLCHGLVIITNSVYMRNFLACHLQSALCSFEVRFTFNLPSLMFVHTNKLLFQGSFRL